MGLSLAGPARDCTHLLWSEFILPKEEVKLKLRRSPACFPSIIHGKPEVQISKRMQETIEKTGLVATCRLQGEGHDHQFSRKAAWSRTWTPSTGRLFNNLITYDESAYLHHFQWPPTLNNWLRRLGHHLNLSPHPFHLHLRGWLLPSVELQFEVAARSGTRKYYMRNWSSSSHYFTQVGNSFGCRLPSLTSLHLDPTKGPKAAVCQVCDHCTSGVEYCVSYSLWAQISIGG
jgi:hypothetical protein